MCVSGPYLATLYNFWPPFLFKGMNCCDHVPRSSFILLFKYIQTVSSEVVFFAYFNSFSVVFSLLTLQCTVLCCNWYAVQYCIGIFTYLKLSGKKQTSICCILRFYVIQVSNIILYKFVTCIYKGQMLIVLFILFQFVYFIC